MRLSQQHWMHWLQAIPKKGRLAIHTSIEVLQKRKGKTTMRLKHALTSASSIQEIWAAVSQSINKQSRFCKRLNRKKSWTSTTLSVK